MGLRTPECQTLGDHAACPDWVWDGVDSLFCSCICHPDASPPCQHGDHAQCPMNTIEDAWLWARLICDCPCHLLEFRSRYVELRSRAAS